MQLGDSETIKRIWGNDPHAALLGGAVPPPDALLSEASGNRERMFPASPLPWWDDCWFGRAQFSAPADAARVPLARSLDQRVWPGYLAALAGASLTNPDIRGLVNGRADESREGFLFETQMATWNQMALPTGRRIRFGFDPVYPMDRDARVLGVDTGGEEFGPGILRMVASRWQALDKHAASALSGETEKYQQSVGLIPRYGPGSRPPEQRGYEGLSSWQSIPRIATEAASMSGVPWFATDMAHFPATGSFFRTAVSLVGEGIPLIFIDRAANPLVAISTTESGQIGCYNPVGSVWTNYDGTQFHKVMSDFVVAPVLGWRQFQQPRTFTRGSSSKTLMKAMLPLAIRAMGGYGGMIGSMTGH